MVDPCDEQDPWSVVYQYLKSTPGSSSGDQLPYTLDSVLARAKDDDSSGPAAMLPFASGETVLGRLRRQLWQHQSAVSVFASPMPADSTDDSEATDRSKADPEWAATQLRSLSDLDSPDFATATQIWQLPNAQLFRLCEAHLSLDNCNGAALAGFIGAAVSNSAVSLENQLLLLRYAASSVWFTSEDAIPAIVQSQILALLQSHSQIIATGLLLPLLENSQRLSPSATAMVVKIVKSSDMPTVALETVCAGLAAWATKAPLLANDLTFQTMEALASAVPADRPSFEWVKAWVGVVEKAALLNRDSKKLGALMLHLVNKFGNKLDSAELDRVAAAANVLNVPLKKAVMATALRKKNNTAS